MRRTFLWLLLVVSTRGWVQAAEDTSPKPLVLTDVTIIDGTGQPAQSGRTLVVSKGRIAAIGSAGQVKVPKDAQVVNGAGKFLIPGLWDMHVHDVDGLSGKHNMELFIANGVTGVRQMFGSEALLDWRRSVEAGSLLGPRMVIASPIVDGPKPFWPGSISVATEKQGRDAVRKIKKDGYDFVKVYWGLSRGTYFAIVDEAKKLGLPVAGHVPDDVGALAVTDAGQASIEHLDGLILACSSEEEQLARRMAEALKKPKKELSTEYDRALTRAAETYDEQKAVSLFARFIRNATWQVPTLTLLRFPDRLGDEDYLNDSRVKYVPSEVKSYWESRKAEERKVRSAEAIVGIHKVWEAEIKLTGAMHHAGVKLLAGTDSPNPYCFTGSSLHDELELLVRAGLTPMEAIQTATRNPAEFLGKLDSQGTIEKGKRADLVLLEADPLENIKNTRKIAAVLIGGRFLPKEALVKMLDDVEAAVKQGK